ncbi:hypothetical protein K227x_43790 [Rubripirellula lacrimiformis]|uniref:4-O-methyl-glucuronoyl methylesterase-like domain-containing protein n=1 Tax=Rubripirellula lacrimiformis TaxID=1930273 RepID=A0A517NFR5_9BACT|nr:acetylxylan esterase [Rubripirellula lacrimiformis]QDT05972.1 hypothetical protein K227x_43790 [Rubripirellula lacrimiformis]
MLRSFCVFLGLMTGSAALAAEPADTNYDESKVPQFTLPDPLVDNAGQAVGPEEWVDHRRSEVLRMFEESVYGKTPDQKLDVRYEISESDADALNGKATRTQIAAYFGTDPYRIDLLVYTPNGVDEPAPAFVGINFNGNHTVHADPAILQRDTEFERGSSSDRWQLETVIDRGYAVATLARHQIDPDRYKVNFSDGVHPLFYSDGQTSPRDDQWGSIGAWAWALSRTLDYLETVPQIDASRVAVIGHSRMGKSALWAGARDPRFAMVVSNDSGCGGAALYRRCYGERIHHMMKPISYWFCKNHRQYENREDELPVDQHMLLALIAPRPLYVASATNDRWADPKGEFLAAKHASPVYEMFGKPALSTQSMPKPDHPIHTTIGYHLRTGDHAITAYDWQQYLAFADTQMGTQ